MGVGSRPPLPLYCVKLLTLNLPAGGVRAAIDRIVFAVASTLFRPFNVAYSPSQFRTLASSPLRGKC